MPSYKLTYFPIRCRGETSRLLFDLAGVSYENYLQDSAKWPEVKPRFMGKNDFEAALIDSLFDTLNDLSDGIMAPVVQNLANNPEAAAAKRESFSKSSPAVLANLERFLQSNNGGNGYFVGDSVSLADIHFFSMLDIITTDGGFPDALKSYPKLAALFVRVGQIPNVAKHMKERPAMNC